MLWTEPGKNLENSCHGGKVVRRVESKENACVLLHWIKRTDRNSLVQVCRIEQGLVATWISIIIYSSRLSQLPGLEALLTTAQHPVTVEQYGEQPSRRSHNPGRVEENYRESLTLGYHTK